MITYFIPHICYKCLCRVCGQRGCPHRFRQEKRCVSCWRSHEYRPILDCTNFYFRHFHKYKVRRVHKAPKIRYIEKFSDGDIAQLLGEILRLLNSPIAPTEDINSLSLNVYAWTVRLLQSVNLAANAALTGADNIRSRCVPFAFSSVN